MVEEPYKIFVASYNGQGGMHQMVIGFSTMLEAEEALQKLVDSRNHIACNRDVVPLYRV